MPSLSSVENSSTCGQWIARPSNIRTQAQTHDVRFTQSGQALADVDLFVNDDDVLEAYVSTERLYLCSVGAHRNELADYQALFASPQAMENFASGEVRSADYTSSRYAALVGRWHAHDPYSSLTARLHDNDDFVGQVILQRSGTPGQAELGAASLPQFWRNGLASEGAVAVVGSYAPKVASAGYLLDGATFTSIYATAKPQNPGSYKTLEKLGFVRLQDREAYGASRRQYLLRLPTANVAVNEPSLAEPKSA